jgi:UDP-glucose 4-epimerase
MKGRVLLTGGAGFIGSHVVDRLVDEDYEVIVLDNFLSGSRVNLAKAMERGNVRVVDGDILDRALLSSLLPEVFQIYHLAAMPEVRVGQQNPAEVWRVNVEGTRALLETMRGTGKGYDFIFTSTSTVYGDSLVLPTPEDYGPLKPISFYGASKLASEAMISAFSFSYGFRSAAIRLANIVGARSRHGVVPDFIGKLRSHPQELVVLGDGRQRKSYLHVSDCVSAFTKISQNLSSPFEAYNIGSDDSIDVATIAKIVIQEMGMNSSITFTGGVDGGRGWIGDVKAMLLSTQKIKGLGWSPRLSSAESIRLTVREILRGD